MLKKMGEMTASFYGGKPSAESRPKPIPTPKRKDPLIRDFDINKDFELKTTLGTGTFGRVRLVKSLRHGKYFALKILKKVRRLERERELRGWGARVPVSQRARQSLCARFAVPSEGRASHSGGAALDLSVHRVATRARLSISVFRPSLTYSRSTCPPVHLPPAQSEIIRLKQVEHIKSECKILAMVQHPFIVNM